MRGARLRRRVIVGMPSSVETRRSTDATAIPDRRIAGALEYIWREAGHNPITVPDVVKKIGSSRRFAEILFKTTVGRTILDEIQRVRLERVCMLLMDTHQSIGEITRQCGFERESYLAHLFKKRFNLTMRAYRMSARNRICAGASLLGAGVGDLISHTKG
jgi:transcriptional regulator GlxA family with amidase domain